MESRTRTYTHLWTDDLKMVDGSTWMLPETWRTGCDGAILRKGLCPVVDVDRLMVTFNLLPQVTLEKILVLPDLDIVRRALVLDCCLSAVPDLIQNKNLKLIMSTKLQEAEAHCKAAEKFLKTSMLKWNPDYDSAADEYSQAAQCYRIGRALKKSAECHMKASEYYNKNRSFFHAAKSLENALVVSKETASPDEMYTMACDSASLYQQHGSGDAAAHVLDKAAKIIAEKAPELAFKLYEQAADVSSAESSQHQGSEFLGKASRILVKLQRYDEAVDSLRREIGYHRESGNTGAVGRLTVAIVLVQLARQDIVAAEKAYKEWGSNCEVPEMQTMEQLLQAYDEEDRESAARALASPFIRSMDVEYARLAGTIKLPESLAPAPRAAVRENAAASYVSTNAGASGSGAGASAEACARDVDEEATVSCDVHKQAEEEDDLC